MLRSHPAMVRELYRVFKDIRDHGARGHGRAAAVDAAVNAAVNGPSSKQGSGQVEEKKAPSTRQHEGDSVVRFHAECALAAVDSFMMRELGFGD